MPVILLIEVFRSLHVSLLLITLAVLGLAVLPVLPRTETASTGLRLAEVELPAPRGSILDRMARHGGTAEIRSTPGNGAEVRLEITR